MVLGIVFLCVGWILFLGLKVLKPQEALVLTLFGKYMGTLKEAGFYFVNPFCMAVNPPRRRSSTRAGTWTAAKKRLRLLRDHGQTERAVHGMPSKKISSRS